MLGDRLPAWSLLSLFALTTPTGATASSRTWGTAADESVIAATRLADGGFAILAELDAPVGGSQDLAVLRFDSAGQLAWNHSYGDGDRLHGGDVVELPDGTIVVSGAVVNAKQWLLALEPSGTPRWQNEIGPVNRTNGFVPYLHVAETGDVVVAGAFTPPPSNGSKETRVRRFAPDGTPIWETLLSDLYEERTAHQVVSTDDGGTLLSGVTVVRWSPTDAHFAAWFVRLDSNGQFLWETVVDGPHHDWAFQVEPTADGGFVGSGGASSTAGDSSGFVVKLDAFGAIEWSTSLTLPGGTLFHVLATETASGRFILTGPIIDGGQPTGDTLFAQLDATGGLSWARAIGGSGEDWFHLLDEVSGGYFAVGGTDSFGAGGRDVWLLELDSSGGVGIGCELTRDVTLNVVRNSLTSPVMPTTVSHPSGSPTAAMSIVGGPHGPFSHEQQCSEGQASEITTVPPWLDFDLRPRPKPWER